MLIVDEFFSLAQGAGIAARIEQARGFNTSLILGPQVVAGMGDEQDAARIVARCGLKGSLLVGQTKGLCVIWLVVVVLSPCVLGGREAAEG